MMIDIIINSHEAGTFLFWSFSVFFFFPISVCRSKVEGADKWCRLQLNILFLFGSRDKATRNTAKLSLSIILFLIGSQPNRNGQTTSHRRAIANGIYPRDHNKSHLNKKKTDTFTCPLAVSTNGNGKISRIMQSIVAQYPCPPCTALTDMTGVNVREIRFHREWQMHPIDEHWALLILLRMQKRLQWFDSLKCSCKWVAVAFYLSHFVHHYTVLYCTVMMNIVCGIWPRANTHKKM